MNNDIRKILEYINTPIENKIYKVLDEKNRKTLSNYIKRLEEENKKCTRKHWQSKCAEYSIKNRLLQNRIDKAIKYIKENEKEYGSLEENEKIILDILGGKDEEYR